MIPFRDHVRLSISSGDGGNGRVSFSAGLRAFDGTPDGGNGGDGGHVIIKCNPNLDSLYHLSASTSIKAAKGEDGHANLKQGAKGSDLILEVPPGSYILNDDLSYNFTRISAENPEYLILKGAKGGRGNSTFKSSVDRSPKKSTPGEEGQRLDITIVYIMTSDIAIVGPANSGKSYLHHCLTHSNSTVANYPYTTTAIIKGSMACSYYEKLEILDLPAIKFENPSERERGHIKHLLGGKSVLLVLMLSEYWKESLKDCLSYIKEAMTEFRIATEPLPLLSITLILNDFGFDNDLSSQIKDELDVLTEEVKELGIGHLFFGNTLDERFIEEIKSYFYKAFFKKSE